MSENRLEAAILLIINSVDNPSFLGTTRLNKICWKSDVENFIRVGKSITGATYKKQIRGPVVGELIEAQNALARENKVAIKEQVQGERAFKALIPLVDSDSTVFSPTEVEILIKNANYIFHNHTASTISEESHDRVWKSFAIGEEIPLCTYLVGEDADITQEDINWGLHSLLC